MEPAIQPASFYPALVPPEAKRARSDDTVPQTIYSDQTLTVAATIAIFVAAILTFDLLAAVYWWHRSMPSAIYVVLSIEWLLLAAIVMQERRRIRLKWLLSASETRIELAAESADLGLWSWDPKTDEFCATKHCQELLGLPPQPHYERLKIMQAVHVADRTLVENAARQLLETNTSTELEFRVADPGGHVRWLRGRGVRSSAGTMQVMGTIMDVTQRRKMQEEVEHQQHSLAHFARVGVVGELSAALAHELNQPLTAIMSNAQAVQQMLGRKPVDFEEISGAIADIIEDDMRAGDVIHHLRSLLKNEDNPFRLCDLNTVVKDSLDLTRSDLIARHISVSRELSTEVIPVLGDHVQLQQVVLNLVLNAAESMESQQEGSRRLVICTSKSGSLGELAVCDSGPGISPESLPKLFQPFFTTKRTGMGLGLSICQAIVTRHGGTITASGNEGGGAVFRISLPIAGVGEHEP